MTINIESQTNRRTNLKKTKAKFSLTAYLVGHREKFEDSPIFSKYYTRITCFPNCDSKKGGPPIIVISLIVIYLIIYGTYSRNFRFISDEFSQISYSENKLVFLPDDDSRKQVWRYFTYQFDHANLSHLLTNLALLLILGLPIETVHSSFRILVIYSIGVITGAMFSYIIDKSILLGCSGGVYSLVFLHLANLVINFDSFSVKSMLITLAINLPIIGLALFEIIQGSIRTLSNNGDQQKVSWAAHFGGGFTGLTFGMIVLKNVESKKWEKKLELVFLGVFIGVFVVMFICQFVL